jgi:hypothetical protein
MADITEAKDKRYATALYLRRVGLARFKLAFPTVQARPKTPLFVPSTQSKFGRFGWPVLVILLTVIIAFLAVQKGVGTPKSLPAQHDMNTHQAAKSAE